jgi:Protein of unknown function (DUF3572)
MPKTGPITREFGENLAVQALGLLAQDPEQLGRFLAATGIGPDQIRRSAADPSFLAGVLDFVMGDEKLLLAVAEYAGVSLESVERAHLALSDRWEREIP